MTRYQILDELLSDRYHDYSLDDLTRMVGNRLADLYPGHDGVTRRCIEKDIAYLEYESDFKVEIERYSVQSINKETLRSTTKRCLRYADPTFSIFKKTMNDDEKYLLREAISMLDQFNGLPNLDALESLRLSLNVSSTENPIISFSKNPLGESTILGELFTAISNKQVVEVEYAKFTDKDNPLVYKVYPYLLKEYNRRWYLIAAAFDDGKIRTYALDRINRATPMPSIEYLPFDGDITERFDDIIGVTLYEGVEPGEILFGADESTKDYIFTKPLHDSQRYYAAQRELELKSRYPSLKGGAFFSIECIKNYELIRELCSYGKGLLVLSSEDQSVQDEVIARIDEMRNAYEGLINKKN